MKIADLRPGMKLAHLQAGKMGEIAAVTPIGRGYVRLQLSGGLSYTLDQAGFDACWLVEGETKPRKPKRRQPSRALLVKESEAQSSIVELLERMACTVLVTNGRYLQAANPNHHLQATPGVPDLLVTRDTWPTGCWLGLEVKAPEIRSGDTVLQKAGAVRPEQQALADRGRIVIVHDAAEAYKALLAMDAELIPIQKRVA
jgi:hypothetical protein